MNQFDPRMDRCRGAVYRAEDSVASVMSRPHRAVRIGREVLVLPATSSFESVEQIQAYVDLVLADAGTIGAYPGRGPVRVQAKRGFRSATYRDGVIHVPAVDPRGRWALTRAVVLHEVAHHLSSGNGHDRTFREALVRLYDRHLGAAAATMLAHLFEPLDDLPESSRVADDEPVPVRRVAALLAKAAATTSSEESEAYLAKAALVAQRHSVDLAVAAMGRPTRAEAPTHRMLTIGAPRSSLNPLLTTLYVQIARAWPVRVDIGPGSTYVLGYGMPADLDQVESVFATASTLMVTRSQEHVRSQTWKGQYYRPADGGAPRPITAGVARNAFCLGFVERLGQRLVTATEEARRSASDEDRPPDGADRVALALRQRDLAVADYHSTVTRARGSWRGSASAAGSATGSRQAGRRAAEEYGRRGISGGRRAIGG